MKKLPISPNSNNPSSVRLNEEDQKKLQAAVKIIKSRYTLPPTFKLNASNILRIALHEFVEEKSHGSA